MISGHVVDTTGKPNSSVGQVDPNTQNGHFDGLKIGTYAVSVTSSERLPT